MSEVKLPPGWLAKQMAEVRESCKNWPTELQPLLSLNAELVRKWTENKNETQRTLGTEETSDGGG